LISIGKDKLISKLFGKVVDDPNFDKEACKILSNKDVEILQFESGLPKNRSGYTLLKIYVLLLKKNLSNIGGLKASLTENFDFVLNNDSCNCENDGCFFDILKENQLYFFKHNYRDKNGEIEFYKVESDFDKIWANLSIREKASLLFLYDEFRNSTLLNIGFIKTNFNLINYQFKMCYLYQPDSEDEQWVREVSTLSNFLIRLDQ
jgi:hypothetical protein